MIKWLQNFFRPKNDFRFTAAQKSVVFAPVMPRCPYCGFEFEAMPKRKRKCPDTACREWIYRKRAPGEKEIRLVTEEEAERIEAEWKRHYEEKEIQEIGAKKYHHVRKRILYETGNAPTHSEVVFNLNEIDLERYLREKDYLKYRSVLRDLAWQLYEEEKFNKSLMRYLQLAFLDLNGVSYLGFDSVMASYGLPPGIVNPMKNIIEELNVDVHYIHKTFIGVNAVFHHQHATPLSPYEVWDRLKEQLFK